MTTIKDVAEKAGVSVATVSRVLNNKPFVSDKMREHVMGVIAEVNYQPDAVARGLRTKSTRIISLVIPDINNPYFPEVARGVESVADRYEYIVVLCNTDRKQKREINFYEKLMMQRVEGIIVNPSNSSEEEIEILSRLDMPVVLISSQSEFENFDIVMVDNVEGAKLAVNHLIEYGHRKIGLLGGSRDVSSSQKRYDGFIEALQTAGIEIKQNFITEDSLDNEGGYRCAKQLLAQKEKPTAMFATNDTMAIGALSAIHEAGLRIPDDISLIGFDDLSFSKMTYPKLTTIRQPKFKTGEVAAEQLFKHLISPNQYIPPQKIILDHELIIRETTSPFLNFRF